MELTKLLNVVGARPNFMKIAPIIRAVQACEGMQQVLVHTGQHYDDNLSRVFFDDLQIPEPDVNLGIGSGSRDEQIAAIAAAFEPVMLHEQPDAVLVVGDVNSTIACATVARRHGFPIVHVEAGLRSFDDTMPEELNRRETDQISDFLFVTEVSGMENLRREAVPGKAFLVGNVMVDSLVASLPRIERSTILERLGLERLGYAVSTFHRPSNVDDREALLALLDTIEAICDRIPLVLPMHPRTRHSLAAHALEARLEATANLTLCEPLGYIDFIRLVSRARVVITDSGGIQEETTYLRIPCLTMRDNTERPVTTTVGSNRLLGRDRARLVSALDEVLAGERQIGERPELWDGGAAERIIETLRLELGEAD